MNKIEITSHDARSPEVLAALGKWPDWRPEGECLCWFLSGYEKGNGFRLRECYGTAFHKDSRYLPADALPTHRWEVTPEDEGTVIEALFPEPHGWLPILFEGTEAEHGKIKWVYGNTLKNGDWPMDSVGEFFVPTAFRPVAEPAAEKPAEPAKADKFYWKDSEGNLKEVAAPAVEWPRFESREELDRLLLILRHTLHSELVAALSQEVTGKPFDPIQYIDRLNKITADLEPRYSRIRELEQFLATLDAAAGSGEGGK